ncbi:MAG: type III-B CRISPR module RAMP protein Cmr4 [Deltaproteobacteria bacterium]|nr:type III-B CRISPR module RAMP protein Cmr4 [Deltaproteobacteria bacterium]
MLKKEVFSICTFYAVSPIHAGSGAATSTVDLPIQRERHTNWPHIQASGVKGAMRDHYRNFAGDNQDQTINLIFGSDKDNDKDQRDQTINLIFGSDKDNDKDQRGADEDLPGAISVSDAKLLAFPMRSNVAPFVWVTCPSVLERLGRDLEFAGFGPFEEIPQVTGEEAVWLNGGFSGSVVLEDAVVDPGDADTGFNLPDGFPDLERLLLISDQMFDYCVSSCTEVQTQIKIDSKKGTAKEGALRYEELLPSDSLLYAIVYFSKSSGVNGLQAEMIQGHMEDVIKDFIQIGGDETLGRGICRVAWLKGGNGKGGSE